MTTYTAIPNGDVDQDSPVTQPLMTLVRDNPIGIAEGAAGAPRIWLPALERLLPGTEIRLRSDTAVLITTSTFTTVPNFTIETIQEGTIRVTFEHRRNTNASEVRLLRRRAGANTASSVVSTTSTTFVAGSIDITVQPGDRVTVQHRNTGATDSEIRNVRLQVATGIYFWPVGNSFGEVEGNPTITSP